LSGVPAEKIIKSMNALGRLAEPGEIAAVAAFLPSPDASYLTEGTIRAGMIVRGVPIWTKRQPPACST
jgi:NAD(P)-dependent dehydrogenase (short-subunit alcohol dehydrogenase family)